MNANGASEKVTEYCPRCKRPLVTYTPGNPGFDLHPKATVTVTFSVPLTVAMHHNTEGELVEGSARCIYWRCRLTRWWK